MASSFSRSVAAPLAVTASLLTLGPKTGWAYRAFPRASSPPIGDDRGATSWTLPLLERPSALRSVVRPRGHVRPLDHPLSGHSPRPAADIASCVHSRKVQAPAFGQPLPHGRSRSALVVSHHLDGFLRTRFAGLLHPAASRGSLACLTTHAGRSLHVQCARSAQTRREFFERRHAPESTCRRAASHVTPMPIHRPRPVSRAPPGATEAAPGEIGARHLDRLTPKRRAMWSKSR